mmetsp:Transcript_66823/g.134711  ORF Transcript_66823/g.134711 Transcript_66823/m.134711 type:complete len:82 (+) Transcript_66823:795-1040(+)
MSAFNTATMAFFHGRGGFPLAAEAVDEWRKRSANEARLPNLTTTSLRHHHHDAAAAASAAEDENDEPPLARTAASSSSEPP